MSEWISIKDRLPNEGQEVLIWCGHLATPSEARVVKYHQENPWTPNVTHWQPLPEPPPKPDAFEEWWETLIGIAGTSTHRRLADGPWFAKSEARIVWDAAVASEREKNR